MRLAVPLAALLCVARAAAAPAFSEGWKPLQAPLYRHGLPMPQATGGSVTVSVNPEQPIRPVSPWLRGTNAAVWNGEMLRTAKTSDVLARGGFTMLRFPGGSTSDEYCWDGNYASMRAVYGTDGSVMNQPWAVDTDEFIAVCRAIGAEPMITVNFGLSRYGSVSEATDLAARWVKYCNVDHDYRVKYWEVGNENYGDWERGSVLPNKPGDRLKGAEYGATFNQFVTAMKAVDPTIKIGAVGVFDDDGLDYTGYFWWMKEMLPLVQDTADFLILHNYFIYLGGAAQTSPGVLFGNLSQIAQTKTRVDAMVAKYTTRAPGSIPFAQTEYNIENPAKHDSVEVTNGLFTTAALGEHARAGWANAAFWDVYNGWDATNKGDFGLLARGRAPDIPDITPRPAYYAFALWKGFGDTLVSCASNDSSVKAYGGTFQDGALSVILVNTASVARTVTLSTGEALRYVNANAWQLRGTGYSSQSVTWNGAAGPAAGGGPQDVDAVPPWSLRVPAEGPITLGLAPFTATLMVLLPTTMPGDADLDGSLTLSDAVSICRFAAGFETGDARVWAAADADTDGWVTVQDAAVTLRMAAGLG